MHCVNSLNNRMANLIRFDTHHSNSMETQGKQFIFLHVKCICTLLKSPDSSIMGFPIEFLSEYFIQTLSTEFSIYETVK